jgi:predicted RNase H-like nuclease (RuvC/YqgF family)
MTIPTPPDSPESLDRAPETVAGPSFGDRLRALLSGGLRLLLLAAIAAGGMYGVMEWRVQAVTAQLRAFEEEAAHATARAEALDTSVAQWQADLEQKIARVESAATEAQLLFAQDGEITGLDARLREIDTLRLELTQTRTEMETRLEALQQSVVEEVAKQGNETAQALAQELRWKSLVIKTQGEVLLAQIYWSEGNRGLARDELAIAYRSLNQAQRAAPEQEQEAMKPVLAMAEQTRTALILEQSGARDTLNLLWHRVSELLAPGTAP